MVEKFGLSQPVLRLEDPRLLRGGGRYTDDVREPGTLHGYVLRSPHAHANILSIDTSKAAALPGVAAVLTDDDYVADGYGNIPQIPLPIANKANSKPFTAHYRPLAHKTARYVGDPVAFIVADSIAIAKDAAELIEVEYEPLPAVVQTAAAAEAGSPLVWPGRPDNVSFVHELGDEAAVDAAFAKADRIVRQRLEITRVSANSMENRACQCHYDPDADLFVFRAGLQGLFTIRHDLAAIFKEPETKFRVLAGDTGGSFGMKGLLYPEQILTTWASRRTGRPVKWMAERSEALISDHHGRDNITDAALALDKDGKFLAMKVETIASLGAYVSQLGLGSPTNNLGSLAGVYTTPSIFVRVTGVFTNNNPTAPYRGAGRPEASYVMERLVELAADEMGLDPVELRRRNMIPPTAMPFKTGLIATYDSGEFENTMDVALEAADYRGFEARRAEAKARGKLRGIGVACVIERAAPPGMEVVEIRFSPSGSASVVTGAADGGQGYTTMFTQIVCDKLGLTPDKVRIVRSDTETMAYAGGPGGSRMSAMGTSAALKAAEGIIAKGRRLAAHALEAAEADIVFRDGNFLIDGTDRTIGLAAIARMAYTPARLPPGAEPGLYEIGTYRGTQFNFPNGCHVCELEIDEETGVVELVRYVCSDDVGTVINPIVVKGQVEGGIVQGLGQVFMEQIVYDEQGQLLTGSFMDYAMPRADNLCSIEVLSNPVPTPTNPLGIKGVGEAGTVGALPAGINAVIDALSPLGVRHFDMPATSERLWRVIQEAKAVAQ
jgi:carbon-monoxide dehydrogenase large subunit